MTSKTYPAFPHPEPKAIIIEGDAEGDQDRRPAGHGQLADGGGAGAADHQMRSGEAGGHIPEEGREIGLHLGLGIEGLGHLKGFGPGLLLYAQARSEGLSIVTADRRFADYDVGMLDAAR